MGHVAVSAARRFIEVLRSCSQLPFLDKAVPANRIEILVQKRHPEQEHARTS